MRMRADQCGTGEWWTLVSVGRPMWDRGVVATCKCGQTDVGRGVAPTCVFASRRRGSDRPSMFDRWLEQRAFAAAAT